MSDLFKKVFSKNKDFPWQSYAEETIIIDPKSQNSFELNEVGTVIWNNINGVNSVLVIQEKICDTYQVGEETVATDLLEIMGELERQKLIVESI